MKRILILFLIIVLLFFGFLFRKKLKRGFLSFWNRLEAIKKNNLSLEQIEKQVYTPEPLRVKETKKVEASKLERAEILKWTNYHRSIQGLEKLSLDQTLNQTASEKVEDILEKQYFAHVSPKGEGVKGLAGQFNYDFVSIGENLAMGIFENEKSLVKAWMESKGHRKNILGNYKEIGIGVKKGNFKGDKIWIIVQHFGVPSSICERPKEELKEKIKGNKGKLEILQSKIKEVKEELEKKKNTQILIKQYNQVVTEFNSLKEKTREKVEEYNLQIREYNNCLKRNGLQ